jgi:hypothetical protein
MGWQAPDSGKVEAPLTFQFFKSYDSSVRRVASASGGSPGLLDRSARIKQFTLPEHIAATALFRINLDGLSYYVVLAKSKPQLKTSDLVWVDWNGDKMITDDEIAKELPYIKDQNDARFNGDTQYHCFVPVRFGGELKPFALQVSNDSYLSVIPAGMMVGTLPIGKGIKMAIVDSNMNRSFGEEFDTSENYLAGDFLLIDRNSNGIFDPIDYKKYDPTQVEALTFTKLVQLGQAFYNFEVDPDGTSIAAAPYTGKMAILRFEGATPKLSICRSAKQTIWVAPVKGELHLPDIDWTLVQIQYTLTDPKGKTWRVAFSDSGKSKLPIAGQETTVKCGLPFSMALVETHNNAGFNFAINLKDAGGHVLSGFADSKSTLPPEPMLQILNSKGKVVKELKFSYG